jgi:hypothetical protein
MPLAGLFVALLSAHRWRLPLFDLSQSLPRPLNDAGSPISRLLGAIPLLSLFLVAACGGSSTKDQPAVTATSPILSPTLTTAASAATPPASAPTSVAAATAVPAVPTPTAAPAPTSAPAPATVTSPAAPAALDKLSPRLQQVVVPSATIPGAPVSALAPPKDAAGRIQVEVRLRDAGPAGLAELTAHGASILASAPQLARADLVIDPSRLLELASLSNVQYLTESLTPVNSR